MSKRQTFAAYERSMKVLKTRTRKTLAIFTLFTLFISQVFGLGFEMLFQ
jgi:hypothetical protein